jgi:hypothetical protein
MAIFQVSQERYRKCCAGPTRIVQCTWIEANSAEAANREFRSKHSNNIREGDWVLVKNLESGLYESRVFAA